MTAARNDRGRAVAALRRAVALAALLAAMVAAILICFPYDVVRPIPVASAGHWGGHAYVVAIAETLPGGRLAEWVEVLPDMSARPGSSKLRFLEQGKPIGAPHSVHAEIERLGGGRFSHWGHQLVFSASDNSDPRTNGRSYAVSYAVSAPWWIALVLLGIAVLAWPERGRTLRAVRPHAATVLVILAAAAALSYCFPLNVARPIATATAAPWNGHAYVVPVSEYLPEAATCLEVEPDSSERPSGSRLRLLEEGKPIGAPHSYHVEIGEKGAGRYSHWGNQLLFSASDNSDPRTNGRAYAVSYEISAPWWSALALLAAAIVVAGLTGSRLGGAYAFWGGCAMVAVALNAAFAHFLTGGTVAPDTFTYINWSILRPFGYAAFLHAHHAIFGTYASVPFVQLNLLLAGLFLLAYAVARVTGRYFLGWLVVALALAATHMVTSTVDLLTEAPFAALVMAHVAFVLLYLESGRPVYALLAGLVLAPAIPIKSVAVVLLGPLLVLVAFTPGHRRALLALTFVPAALAWLLPSAYNQVEYGAFESSHIGGMAIGGHVAWLIHPQPSKPYAVEAEIVERVAAPLLAKRPARFASYAEYVSYTANEYNVLLWVTIMPALEEHYRDLPRERCRWDTQEASCPHFVSINRALMALSRQAIAAEPQHYARHVAAHFLAQWRDAVQPANELLVDINGRAEMHLMPYFADLSKALEPVPPPRSTEARARDLLRLQDSPAKKFWDLATLRPALEPAPAWAYRHPEWMLALGLLASLLVIASYRLPPAARAFSYCALCINAYLLGTALAQPSLARYAVVMQGLMAAMVVLGAYLAVASLAGLARHAARAASRLELRPRKTT